MNKSVISFMAILLTSWAGKAYAAYQFNLQPPETFIARQIYDLHTLILLVCLAIFVVVFGFMFYSIIKHRKSSGREAAHFHQNLKVEILWTVIPFFILVGMAYPTTKTILEMKDTSESDMTIKVTGHQWTWQYEYLGEGVRYSSNLATTQDQIDNKAEKSAQYLLEVDKPMVVPAGKKVRLLLTAEDVIHSWWVPSFGVKQDAIPGFIKDSWIRVEKPGIYRGQCAELCGVGHGYMPIVVEVMAPEHYTAWLAEQKAAVAASEAAANKTLSLDELKTQGEKVFMTNCAVCHQQNGAGMAGAFPPLINGAAFSGNSAQNARLEGLGFWKDGKIVMGPKEQHIKIVLNGITGTVMPAFGKQLSDLDIAAVISYERNSWGNQTGDSIQPADVAALRKSANK